MPVTKWIPQMIIDSALDKAEQRMEKAVLIVQATVKRSINIGNRDGNNPSLPGEPPHKVSGDLQRNIHTRVTRTKTEVIGVVGTDVPYGRRLELGFTGTDSKGRTYDQEPRPYLRPGLANSRERLKSILGAK